MFKKNETAAPALSGNFNLTVSFESGFMVLSAGELRFRLRREDVALMANPSALERAFDGAGKPTDRREFDAVAITRFCEIQRLLSHGLNLSKTAAVLKEDEKSLTEFYSWCLSLGSINEAIVLDERTRIGAQDVLPLTPSAYHIGDFTGEQIRTVRVNALWLKRLLSEDGDAATALGVQGADLDEWLKNNSALMAVLS